MSSLFVFRSALLILLLCCFQERGFVQLKARTDSCPPLPAGSPGIFFVPEQRAEYPGGAKKMHAYIREKAINQIVISQSQAAVFMAPVLQWTIDEAGNVTDVKIRRSSNVASIDALFMSAVKSMPAWKPAEHMGKKVRDEFFLPLHICFR